MNAILQDAVLMPIPGFEGKYSASSGGEIYSIRRNKLLAQAKQSNGYHVVSISVGGNHKTMKVHRLVAMAFIQNTHNFDQVNHINGIKHDNRSINLEWCNASMNQNHARALGLSKTTDAMRMASANNIKNHGRTKRKLSSERVAEIKKSSLSCIKAGVVYGVSSSVIHQIRKGKTYAEL